MGNRDRLKTGGSRVRDIASEDNISPLCPPCLLKLLLGLFTEFFGHVCCQMLAPSFLWPSFWAPIVLLSLNCSLTWKRMVSCTLFFFSLFSHSEYFCVFRLVKHGPRPCEMSFSACLGDPDPTCSRPHRATILQGYPNPQGSTMPLAVHRPTTFCQGEERRNINEDSWLFKRTAVSRGGQSVYWAGLFSSPYPTGHGSVLFNWLRLSDSVPSNSKENSSERSKQKDFLFFPGF